MAQATQTTGRFALGVQSSTERYQNTDSGSDSNDFLSSSQRVFYKISDYGDDKWEFVMDFRNKYDAFDKLNKELLQLDPKDEFQARQFSARWLNPKGVFSASFGRFQCLESGAIYVDGLLGEYRISPEWTTGLLAGLNPKIVDQPQLKSDPKAQEAAIYLTYRGRTGGWDSSRYLTHGMVVQKYNDLTERQFFFHNGIFQWEENSRIISLAYVDFVPRSYVQTASLIYQQSINEILSTEIGFLGIDTIEYQRRQNVLSILSPSPYKEGNLSVNYNLSRDQSTYFESIYGAREIDQLKKTEISLGYRLKNFITNNWDTEFKLGTRKNFTSQDQLIRWDLGYFSNSWEYSLDLEYVAQNNDDGTKSHPLTSELGVTSFFSKEIFATASLQRSADETVNILGVFLKIGYRFGNKELPPIRDGAPPRGRL